MGKSGSTVLRKKTVRGIKDGKDNQAGEDDGAIYDPKGHRVTNRENGKYNIKGKKLLIKK